MSIVDANAEPTERRFKVEGMDCASCVQRVETALGRIDGVSNVTVNLTTETLIAAIRDDAANDAVMTAVKSLGYRVASLPARRTHSAPTEQRFKVEGMDCGSCVQKIRTALGGIEGVSDVTVNLTTETLGATIRDEAAKNAVLKAVKALGYQIASLPARRSLQVDNSAPLAPVGVSHDHDHDHDHGHAAESLAPAGKPADAHDHASPLDRHWVSSNRGRLVVGTGILLAGAFLTSLYWPKASEWVFVVACVIGLIPIARRAISAARFGSVFTIEMLMTIATFGALAIGAAEEAAVVVFLFAVGELLEAVAAGRARAGIKALAAIAPKTALVETEAGIQEIPVENLAIDHVVVVRPGDRIPADGTVIAGVSSVDESALTGESMPRLKETGSAVFAGSVNTEATLRCRVEKLSTDTLIARVVELVEQAAQAKAPTERFIDRFSRLYMPAICLLALVVMLAPPLLVGAPWGTWIYRGLALLLIGCPCALVISTPAAISSALAAGARRGILVKGGAVLEAIGKVKAIAFDKTGTLTEGRPQITDIVPFGGDEKEVLRLAASIETTSSHPLAVAIVARAKADQLAIETALETSAIPGKGVKGRVGGKEIFVGAASRLGSQDPAVMLAVQKLQQDGKTVSIVLVDGVTVGLIALRDEPREDAGKAVRAIEELGIRVLMLTGDNAATAQAIGSSLGMEVRADLLPEDKLAVIRELSKDGGVATVGDGINDAPALAAATVGIAMGSGTDVALETADAAILRNRVDDVGMLVKLSRSTLSIIHQNVAIALGLKAVFLITTILGVTGLWIAILADTGATVLVTANALRLLRIKGT